MAQNLTYTQCGDYKIPNIRLAYTDAHTLGNDGNSVPTPVGSTADL